MERSSKENQNDQAPLEQLDFSNELELASMSVLTRFTIHGSLLTMNSVLVGAFGIIQAISQSTSKVTLVIYLLISFSAMALILAIQLLIWNDQKAGVIQGVVDNMGKSTALMGKYRIFYDIFKDEKLSTNNFGVLRNMEKWAIVLTLGNMLVFMCILMF